MFSAFFFTIIMPSNSPLKSSLQWNNEKIKHLKKKKKNDPTLHWILKFKVFNHIKNGPLGLVSLFISISVYIFEMKTIKKDIREHKTAL